MVPKDPSAGENQATTPCPLRTSRKVKMTKHSYKSRTACCLFKRRTWRDEKVRWGEKYRDNRCDTRPSYGSGKWWSCVDDAVGMADIGKMPICARRLRYITRKRVNPIYCERLHIFSCQKQLHMDRVIIDSGRVHPLVASPLYVGRRPPDDIWDPNCCTVNKSGSPLNFITSIRS